MSGASVIEAMLLRWGESPTGRTVTFLLPEDSGSHPFKGLKTGPANGQRLALSIALIGDDESTASHEPVAQKVERATFNSDVPGSSPGGFAIHPKPRSRAQRAGILCGDARFRRFLDENHGVHPVTGADDAAAVVRTLCRVKSRSEFDTDEAAGKRWDWLESAYLEECM